MRTASSMDLLDLAWPTVHTIAASCSSSSDAAKNFMRCSTATRQLVLRANKVTLNVTLGSPQSQILIREGLELLTSSKNSTARLVLSGAQEEGLESSVDELEPLSICPAVHQVTLQDLQLDALVPPALVQGCPNLTNLTLRRCTLPQPTSLASVCTALNRLDLSSISNSSSLGPSTSTADMSKALASQLKCLPSLSSVTFNGYDCPSYEAFSAVGSQLTHLCNIQHLLPDPCQAFSTWASTALPNLLRLELPYACLDTASAEAVLQLPQLTHLVVEEVDVRRDLSGSTCSWRCLRTQRLSLLSCAYLPMSNLQALHLGPDAHVHCVNTGYMPTDLTLTATAMTVLHELQTRSTGLQWADCKAVTLHLSPSPSSPADGQHVHHDAEHGAALVAATLPLFTAVTGVLNISGVRPVTPALFSALTTHLPPSVHTISFTSCHWQPDTCGQLLAALPPSVSEVQIIDLDEPPYQQGCLPMSEALLLEVCWGAVRKVRIVWDAVGCPEAAPAPGCAVRLESALAGLPARQQGCQPHVRVQVLGEECDVPAADLPVLPLLHTDRLMSTDLDMHCACCCTSTCT